MRTYRTWHGTGSDYIAQPIHDKIKLLNEAGIKRCMIATFLFAIRLYESEKDFVFHTNMQ